MRVLQVGEGQHLLFSAENAKFAAFDSHVESDLNSQAVDL